jgi:hypothetical protein
MGRAPTIGCWVKPVASRGSAFTCARPTGPARPGGKPREAEERDGEPRLSHRVALPVQVLLVADHVGPLRVELGRHRHERVALCPGRQPPFWVVKRPARPCKAPHKTDLRWES